MAPCGRSFSVSPGRRNLPVQPGGSSTVRPSPLSVGSVAGRLGVGAPDPRPDEVDCPEDVAPRDVEGTGHEGVEVVLVGATIGANVGATGVKGGVGFVGNGSGGGGGGGGGGVGGGDCCGTTRGPLRIGDVGGVSNSCCGLFGA